MWYCVSGRNAGERATCTFVARCAWMPRACVITGQLSGTAILVFLGDTRLRRKRGTQQERQRDNRTVTNEPARSSTRTALLHTAVYTGKKKHKKQHFFFARGQAARLIVAERDPGTHYPAGGTLRVKIARRAEATAVWTRAGVRAQPVQLTGTTIKPCGHTVSKPRRARPLCCLSLCVARVCMCERVRVCLGRWACPCEGAERVKRAMGYHGSSVSVCMCVCLLGPPPPSSDAHWCPDTHALSHTLTDALSDAHTATLLNTAKGCSFRAAACRREQRDQQMSIASLFHRLVRRSIAGRPAAATAAAALQRAENDHDDEKDAHSVPGLARRTTSSTGRSPSLSGQ